LFEFTAVLVYVDSRVVFFVYYTNWELPHFILLYGIPQDQSRSIKRAAIRLYKRDLLSLQDILSCCGFSESTWYRVLTSVGPDTVTVHNSDEWQTLDICVKLPRFHFFKTVGGGLGIFGSESDITSIPSTSLLVIGIRILIHIYLSIWSRVSRIALRWWKSSSSRLIVSSLSMRLSGASLFTGYEMKEL